MIGIAVVAATVIARQHGLVSALLVAARVNEQLRGDKDLWLVWVRALVAARK